ncbi:phosphoglycolate phosphatase [Halobacteriales archaeon SW_8_65_20]|nr:MAG: phosphoglycolate phosphatase [Halobacteriales archaeon SW_8_65_20]
MAVVYDLDGTLVRLAVDWAAVTDDCVAVLADRGIEFEYETLWDVYEYARDAGQLDIVEETIARHEREGARSSERLDCADLLARDAPVAVCSLNSQRACEIALDRHDLSAHAAAVVGRDTVETEKPDPEPLRTAIDALGVDPEQVTFVGDGERDELTADRVGVAFSYVEPWLAA